METMAVEDVATAFIAGNSLGPRRSTESAATAASAMAPIGSTASLDDPPPLEEPLAKFILTVVGRFLQTSAPDLFENTAVVAMNAATTTTNPTSSALDAKVETAQADPSVNQTRTLLMSDVHKSAGRILFYVSASNWPIVFQRLKARLMFLAGTNDENADTSDLRLLEWCNLNSKRLSSVIQDLCTVFLQMKRNSQLAMAVVLRKAIWNWIEVYPKDFMQLNRQQRRLDGGPEILFDNCNGLTESNPRKKAMFWPLQVMLLVLCPDILLKIVLSDSTYKKAGFIDNLKNSLKASRLAADIAAVAFVDLCKAATYVNRDEKSALWQLVPEVENELKERLFDASKPFLTPEGAIDQRLMTECLTALFRLDPRKTLKNLIPVCLQSSAPMAFKLVLVKSCYAIASESHLSWNPSISSMYTELASSFRQILHTAVREKQSQEALAAAQPTPLVPQKTIRKPFDNRAAKKNAAVSAANTEASERHELVLNILRLYRTDPKLAIFSDSADRQREENRALMVGLTNWLRDPSPALRNNAAETLLSLHKPVYMEQWGAAGDAMRSFWIISSQVMLALARQLLEYKERDEGLRLTLDLLMQLLVLRNDFLRKKKDMINNGIEAPDRLSASVALEVALLVLLCSAETEICSKAIACLGHLCEEARLADEVPTTLDEIEDETQEPGQTSLYSSQLTVVENFITYAELTSVGVLMPGRVAQQKRIRKMLRKMDKQTPGNLAAWEEAYKRWRALMQAVAKPFDSDAAEGDAGTMSMANAGQKDPPVKKPGFAARMVGLGSMTNQAKAAPAPTNHPSPAAGVLGASDFLEDRGEWQNYTGFLCALGGVCLHERGRERIKAIAMQGPPTTESGRMIDRFVHELVDLLVCDNMVVREVVQQTLGADLSPSLYVILFRHLENVVDRFFDNDSVATTDRWTSFVEQSISVFRAILDRIHEAAESLYAVDVSGLVLSFAKYLQRLGNTATALRVKLKMCLLLETLMAKKDFIGLRQEIKFRNKLLEIIIEWTSDFAKHDADRTALAAAQEGNRQAAQGGSLGVVGDESAVFHRNERLHRELDQACMKTVCSLLYQLPLQSTDLSRDLDVAVAKGRLFYKYFSFFLKLLNRCRVLEAIDNGAHTTRSNHELRMLLSKSKEAVRDLGPLKDHTITALSNLLSANIDSGLKYSLHMGYHEDQKTRTAFMQVLTNILYQGAEFEGLAENVKNDRYEKLVDLLMDNELAIALALSEVCPATEVDSLGGLLLLIAEKKQATLKLLMYVLERELARTDLAPELFRRNCIATRLMGGFAKLHGYEYLRDTLQPLLSKTIGSEANYDFELDPTRLAPGADATKNLSAMKQMTQRFLDEIFDSASSVPPPIREVCYYLGKIVSEKFPEARLTAVGGFLFLRFFCPAICAPETHGLVQPIQSREVRRGLVLIAKVIQNLANHVLFGTKEAFMIPMNDFLLANMDRVDAFLLEISSSLPGGEGPVSQSAKLSASQRLEEAEMMRVHRYLFENLEKIGRELSARRQPIKSVRILGKTDAAITAAELEKQYSASRRAFEKLSTVIAQLGPPPDEPKKSMISTTAGAAKATNQAYKDFMSRYAIRDLEAMEAKRLFYEGGYSKERRPMFYYIARRVNAETMDMELLLFYILHTMEHAFNRPYELVLDLTLFSMSNEIPNQWILQLLNILPFEAEHNLAAIYFYNINSAFKKWTKKISKSLSPKLAKRSIFAITLAELHEYVSPSELRLPTWTTALEMENGFTFTPVTKITHYKMPIPTAIKVCSEVLQVTTLRKQEIFGMNAIFNDVYRNSDIEDISILTHRTDDSAIVLKFDKGNTTLTFSSNKAETMFQSIRSSMARMELTKPSAAMNERIIRPNDVPGTLLNMALLNLGSEEANLRLAAYNLLYALCVTFNFNVGGQLLSAKANSTAFVRAVSEKLAASEPHLTVEFLHESFVGYHKSTIALKNLCLEYMAPWLANMAKVARGATDDHIMTQKKLKEILQKLIELTVKDAEMYHAVQNKIWLALGRVDDIIPMLIDAFVTFSVDNGMSSQPSDIIANTIVTLHSVNVRGKIVARLRRVIQNTSLRPTRTLTDHASWGEICVLIRFAVMLSFNNRLRVQQYLPEIFHVISIIAATGPSIIRSSVHGIVINAVQSLCTTQELKESRSKQLTLLLSEFSEPKTRLLFGLTRASSNAFTRTAESIADNPESMPLSSLETIVHMMLDAMALGAPDVEASNAWRARWMSLVTSTAFQFNPAIQPRAFVVLGCLARDEVDDDLLYQILVALKGALSLFDDGDCSLIVSIVMCLTSIAENLTKDSPYLRQMFWLAMVLVQIGHVPLFPSALNLLEVVLRNLESHGCFAEETPAEFLMKRRIPIKDTPINIYQSFEVNFSFAVSTVLLKGLKHPLTVTATSSALTTLLEITCKSRAIDGKVNPDVLGYLTPLLPQAAKNSELHELLWLVGINTNDDAAKEGGDAIYRHIFERLTIPDDNTAMLLISMMVTMLSNAEFEAEQLFLYGFLAEAAKLLPDVFNIFYESLLTKMNQVLGSSQSVDIIEAVQSILYTMVSSPATRIRRQQRPPLSEIGFGSLPECGSFHSVSRAQKKAFADLASKSVELMVG